MRETVELLASWSGFYVMMGSAAAALTGIMFVVISLVRTEQRGTSEDGIATFSTPTVAHFCGALFVSAVMAAPYHSLLPVALLMGAAGAVGLAYVTYVARRTARLQSYTPDLEDWAWHMALPYVAYGALLVTAFGLHLAPARALYLAAAAVALLIFIGIHNAWDVVTFLATGKADALDDQRNR